jgi:hypothetical protein
MKTNSNRWQGVLSGLGLCLCVFTHANDNRPAVAPPGHPPRPQGFHSFVGANVVVSPSLTVTNATLVINNGKVVTVSQSKEAAPGSRKWDLEGFTIYPGFIDPYYVISQDGSPVVTTRTTVDEHATHKATGHWNFYGMPGDELDPGSLGPGSSLSTVHPEYSVLDDWVFKASHREKLRNLGFTAVHLSPAKGIFRGKGAVSLTGESSPNELIQNNDGFQHIAFTGRDGKAERIPEINDGYHQRD